MIYVLENDERIGLYAKSSQLVYHTWREQKTGKKS